MRIVTAPPVYDPGGPVALALNLAEEPSIAELVAASPEGGAVLCVVRCPVGDPAEAELTANGFAVASEWYRATLPLPSPSLFFRPLIEADLDAIEGIAEARRHQYAGYQPVFWRVHPNAVENHKGFLASQITRPEILALAADDAAGNLQGYVLADNRGIDDFGARVPELWKTVGAELLKTATAHFFAQGVPHLTVICGQGDEPKRAMLRENGLVCVECWWTLTLESDMA